MLTYAVSTLLVICWLIFTIQITLQENKEVAEGVASIGRTTEFIKVAISLIDLHPSLLSCCEGTTLPFDHSSAPLLMSGFGACGKCTPLRLSAYPCLQTRVPHMTRALVTAARTSYTYLSIGKQAQASNKAYCLVVQCAVMQSLTKVQGKLHDALLAARVFACFQLHTLDLHCDSRSATMHTSCMAD